MNKYWKIWWRVFKMSFMESMMYKQDFVLASITTFVYFLTQIALIYMFFEAGGISEIGGYRANDIYFIFTLTQSVVFFIFVGVQRSARLTIDQIHAGGLDFFIIKPIDSRFLISFQNFRASHAYIILMYIVIFIPYLVVSGNYGFDLIDWMIILYILLLSIVVYSVMYWMAALVHLFVPRLWGPWMFMGNIGDIMKYPKDVYPGIIGGFLTYVIPVFLVVNPIYKVIDGSIDVYDLVEISLLTVVFVMLYLIMWTIGLKRYNSAN